MKTNITTYLFIHHLYIVIVTIMINKFAAYIVDGQLVRCATWRNMLDQF